MNGSLLQWVSSLTCQRLVNGLFQGLIGSGLFIYLDDLILVSRDLEPHFDKLELVLQKKNKEQVLNLTSLSVNCFAHALSF